MILNRRKIALGTGSLIVLVAAFFSYRYVHEHVAKAAAYQTPEEASNVYVRFAMEAYDSIQKNYWMPHDQYNLPQIYELSLEKVLSKQGIAAPTDRNSTAAAVAAALKLATSTEAEKNDVLNAVAVVLYNLQPVARDSLMSSTQVTSLRNEVSNKNPTTGEVEPTIASASTTPGVPVEGARVIGKTIYIPMSQIAPTTLQEFANVVNAASTTPLDSMVLDMRGNIGGAMDFLPAFLGLWVGQDQYAFDLFSQGTKNVVRTTEPAYAPLSRYEIAILTDGGTMSTAELTTDAFKRYHLGKSVGVKSRGWGTIENTYPLNTVIDASSTYQLLLVNSLTVREDNQPIEGNGVVPDVDVTKADWKSELAGQFHSSSLISALKTLAAPKATSTSGQ